jgi:hypothetical protein
MLISDSGDGRDNACTRQNAGKVLKAVKNPDAAPRTVTGATNLPESTISAEVIVVFSNRRPRSAAQDMAPAGTGAMQQSASAKTSELFKNLFRLFGIVADDSQLDQIIRDAGNVKRLEVDPLVAEPVRDAGEYARLVLE